MNKLTLSVAAALMLSTAPLTNAIAQDQQDKGSSSMKQGGEQKAPAASNDGPPSARSSEQAGEKSDGASQKRSASEQKEPGSSKKDSANSDKGEAKEKNADRGEKSSNKQSEEKTQQPSSKKADSAPNKKSNDAADAKKTDDSKRNADSQKGDDNKRNADTKKGHDSERNADANKPADDTKRSASDDSKLEKAKTADLSGDKKDRVKTSFKSENVKKITNVNIDISVGRRLPRDWDYHPVPQAVILIVPEYSGYRYAYVEDRYVIVDPDTYEVVYVLDDTGGGSASVGRSTGESGSTRCTTELTFSQEDRAFIYEKVHKNSASVKIGNLEVGVELPGDARVETFPAEVTSRVSKLDSCRYVVIDEKIAVVDPSDDKIVAIIED